MNLEAFFHWVIGEHAAQKQREQNAQRQRELDLRNARNLERYYIKSGTEGLLRALNATLAKSKVGPARQNQE